MAKTVVGLFENRPAAQQAIRALLGAGFSQNYISEVTPESNYATANTIGDGLVGAGLPQRDAQLYSDGVRRGGTLVVVSAPDNQATRAYEIIQGAGALDLNDQFVQGQSADYSYQNTQNYQGASASNLNQGEAVLPVVEEQLQVGKRPVQTGGVRVYSTVQEHPVEQPVTLREEHVNVQRRAVNRPVSPDDVNAIREGNLEVNTMAEQPVVNKQARVVEEVVVNKDVQERNQTIRDTVRRTDVNVDQLDSETLGREQDYRNP
jgi:uncharacterized protein (TIGR02271 family)